MVSGQSKMEPQHSDSPTPEMPSGGAISRREKPGTGKEGPEGPMPPTLGPLGPRQHPLLAGHSGGTLAQLILLPWSHLFKSSFVLAILSHEQRRKPPHRKLNPGHREDTPAPNRCGTHFSIFRGDSQDFVHSACMVAASLDVTETEPCLFCGRIPDTIVTCSSHFPPRGCAENMRGRTSWQAQTGDPRWGAWSGCGNRRLYR